MHSHFLFLLRFHSLFFLYCYPEVIIFLLFYYYNLLLCSSFVCVCTKFYFHTYFLFSWLFFTGICFVNFFNLFCTEILLWTEFLLCHTIYVSSIYSFHYALIVFNFLFIPEIYGVFHHFMWIYLIFLSPWIRRIFGRNNIFKSHFFRKYYSSANLILNSVLKYQQWCIVFLVRFLLSNWWKYT